MPDPRPDPRGPLRTVTEIMPGNCDGNSILLDCGHDEVWAPHIRMPRIGTEIHCFHCGRVALAKWKAATV